MPNHHSQYYELARRDIAAEIHTLLVPALEIGEDGWGDGARFWFGLSYASLELIIVLAKSTEAIDLLSLTPPGCDGTGLVRRLIVIQY
jgi:hypothetical protein